jgi:hypothetical protein
MTYHNILSNPTLQTSEDSLHVEKIHVLDYPPQYIWHPIQWKTTVTPTIRGQYTKRADDLHIIPTVWPQTVNGNRVLTIEANTKHFVVKLEQLQIPLKAHQRYLVKVLFTPAVQPMGDANPTDLTWRITMDKRSSEYTDGFQSAASIGEWGQQRSALLVVHSLAEQTVDLWVEFWSKFGNLDKQIYIHSIEMLEVDSSYGEGGSVHEIGTATTPEPEPEPTPDSEPDTDTPTAPPWLLWVMLAVCGIILAVIIYGVFRPRLSAQGVTSMEIISITEAGNILLAAIGAILAGGLAAPVTQPVVNLLKFVLKLAGLESKVSANTLSLVVAAVVSVAIWLSRHFGMELQAANVMDWLAVALPIVLSGLSMFLSQKGMYALSQRYEIPLFGYQRSE